MNNSRQENISILSIPVQLYRVCRHVSGRPSYSPQQGVGGLHIYSVPSDTGASALQVVTDLAGWFCHPFSSAFHPQTLLTVWLLDYGEKLQATSEAYTCKVHIYMFGDNQGTILLFFYINLSYQRSLESSRQGAWL